MSNLRSHTSIGILLLCCSFCALAQNSVNSNTTASGTIPGLCCPGTPGTIPFYKTSTTFANSVIFQSELGVGIETTQPLATLDVNGNINAAFGIQLGERPFAFGSYDNSNAFIGFAGSFDGTATGYINTAIGAQALYSNGTGSYNTADGVQALYSNTTGTENTAVGVNALYDNSSGSDLTCIGYGCAAGDDLTNATAIGAHAVVAQSNSLVLGSTGVKVGIGTTTPSNILTIGRGTGHPVSDSWETYSSRRWKTNITTLPDALSKVEQLRGVSYDSKDSGKHEIGVIAEEVGAVVPEVVTWEKNGKDAEAVDYGRLTALLIEATKQQQRLIDQQQQEIARLRSQVKAIQTSLAANGRTGSDAHIVKTQAGILHQ